MLTSFSIIMCTMLIAHLFLIYFSLFFIFQMRFKIKWMSFDANTILFLYFICGIFMCATLKPVQSSNKLHAWRRISSVILYILIFIVHISPFAWMQFYCCCLSLFLWQLFSMYILWLTEAVLLMNFSLWKLKSSCSDKNG